MTDLDAIRARHVPFIRSYPSGDFEVCAVDGYTMPCDTAIVLAALDAATTTVDAFVDGLVAERDADHERWDGLSARLIVTEDERDAAIEREARLRAALQDVIDWLEAEHDYPRPDPHPAMLLQARQARAALATTPEGE